MRERDHDRAEICHQARLGLRQFKREIPQFQVMRIQLADDRARRLAALGQRGLAWRKGQDFGFQLFEGGFERMDRCIVDIQFIGQYRHSPGHDNVDTAPGDIETQFNICRRNFPESIVVNAFL